MYSAGGFTMTKRISGNMAVQQALKAVTLAGLALMMIGCDTGASSPGSGKAGSMVPPGQIAFVSERVETGGNLVYGLFMSKLDGTEETQLASIASGARDLTWTADGKRILYWVSRVWDGTTKTYRGMIYEVDLEGDRIPKPIFVVPDDPLSHDVSGVTFLPQSERIYVDVFDNASKSIKGYILDLSGVLLQEVDQPLAYNLSPDGNKRVLIERIGDSNHEIFVENADGSGKTQLTTNPGSDLAPAWSPDSSRIAFVSLREEKRQLYVMNADGSNQTSLTVPPVDMSSTIFKSASWSPDGKYVAFILWANGTNIYVANVESKEMLQVTHDYNPETAVLWRP
jgi:WD40 repeat protein